VSRRRLHAPNVWSPEAVQAALANEQGRQLSCLENLITQYK
jgi:hypothetical protein